jgi:hypothetical protein
MAGRKKGRYLEGGILIEKAFLGVSEQREVEVNGVFLTGIKENCGTLFIRDVTNSKVGIFRIEGTTIVSVSANAIYSITKDTASKLNAYWETGQFKVQNKTAAVVSLRVAFLGI